MARRYDSRRVKIHHSYNVAEIEKLLGVHKNTVLRWMKAGLNPIERKRPLLIHGSDLRAFLKAHNPRKQPCRAGELYCVKCRVPKRPAGDMVDYVPRSPMAGTIQGLCPTCESIIYRVVKRANLDTVCAGLNVSHRDRQERLGDTPNPSLNSAFTKVRE
jgi:hypothetical protein